MLIGKCREFRFSGHYLEIALSAFYIQIEHMKSFIEKEAQEKAEEILAKVGKYGYHRQIWS